MYSGSGLLFSFPVLVESCLALEENGHFCHLSFAYVSHASLRLALHFLLTGDYSLYRHRLVSCMGVEPIVIENLYAVPFTDMITCGLFINAL